MGDINKLILNKFGDVFFIKVSFVTIKFIHKFIWNVVLAFI